MSALCVIDEAPATVGNLCSACVMTLHTTVLQVPRLLVELEVTVAKQSRQQAGGGYGGEGRPLVVNLAASDRADVVRAELRRMAASAGSGYVPSGEDARELAVWTCTRLSSVARRPDVAELWHGLVDAVREGWRAVDRAPERRVIGTCDCGQVLATPHATGMLRCRGCGAQWDIGDSMRSRAMDVRERTATPEEAAGLIASSFGVSLSAATVRKWVTRKALAPVVVGTTRVRIGDVMDVWESRYGELPGRAA